jgi:glycosyltransferase involved in cell wall biosynthesis
MKKVVHITTVHHPFDTRIYHKECLSLHKAGFDVTLIAPANEEQIKKSRIPILPIKKSKNRFWRMISSTFQAYKKAKALKADYYHIHDPELMPVAWLLKNKNNTVIYDIHEDYVTSILQKKYLKKPFRLFFAKLYSLVEKLFIGKLELCLAEKYYKEKYPKGICILNYPMINQGLMHSERHNESVANELLYTGNVTLDRGALIHARIPTIDHEVKVQYIGKCSKEIASKIWGKANDKKDHIKIEGIDRFVEREQIDEMYLKKQWLAGLALFPPTEHYMKKELTKFFEYMSAGIPILCSDFPVWKNFVKQYKCGIAVDPYNDEEIKQAIEYLKTHPEQVKEMGENGKKAIMNQLNWGEEERKLVKWYNEIY